MTIDAEKPLVNSNAAQDERTVALRELVGIAIKLKVLPEAAFLEEAPKAISCTLEPLFERDLLTQDQIRGQLLKAANGRAACVRLVDDLIPPPRVILPKPFACRDPATIPTRPKIMGDDYVRGYVSATVAPGGIGKSALVTVEILALVTGRRLLHRAPTRPMRVWYIGEDDQDELDRRFAAAMKYYGITAADIAGRLFVQSFRDCPIVVAANAPGGTIVNISDTRAIINAMRENRMDVLICDPFVKTHRVTENDNMAMDVALTAWNDVAHRAKAAVHLVVHTRKASPGLEKSIEDMRGGSSQLGAVRSARLIARMDKQEASALGIDPKTARLHIRVADAKANMMPPAMEADWMKLHSVFLGNATDDPNADNPHQDSVQVVDRFRPPSIFEKADWQQIDAFMRELGLTPRRADVQSADWIGHLIGEHLDIDTSDAGGKALVKAMIKKWEASGAIVKTKVADASRMKRPHYTLGDWTFGGPLAT